MEGPGPCPRGGSSLKTDSRPGTADSSLSARASPPGPSGFARPPPTGREPVFEVARSSLGLGDPRGHRIPPCRSVAVRSKRPGPRPLAARRLLPGIRCEDRGGSVPRSGSAAAMRAAEVFLSRQLFLERHSGRVMNPEFVRLHYPLYHGYDILGGLKAMAEIGRIDDPRCEKALDLLEEKQLPGGGWAAERR